MVRNHRHRLFAQTKTLTLHHAGNGRKGFTRPHGMIE